MAGLSVTALITIAIIAESVIAKNAPVRRVRVGRANTGCLRNHPDLAQNEGHTLPELVFSGNGIRAGNGILKERGLNRRQAVVRFAVGIQDRLIGQVGSVQGELRVEPVGNGCAFQLLYRGWCRSPGCLIQKAGRASFRCDLGRCRLREYGRRQRHQQETEPHALAKHGSPEKSR